MPYEPPAPVRGMSAIEAPLKAAQNTVIPPASPPPARRRRAVHGTGGHPTDPITPNRETVINGPRKFLPQGLSTKDGPSTSFPLHRQRA